MKDEWRKSFGLAITCGNASRTPTRSVDLGDMAKMKNGEWQLIK